MSSKTRILLVLLIAVILTAVQFVQFFSLKEKKKAIASRIEKIQVEKGYLQPEELFGEDIEPVINKATSQENLARGIFDVTQMEEGEKCANLPPERYSPLFDLSYFISSPYKEDFTSALDAIEKKWLSLPIDDYYDEVGLFLLYANYQVGRFPQADAIFEKMAQNCKGKSVDPQFDKYTVMKRIESQAAFGGEFWRPREDLSLLYAASLAGDMYMLQGKQDKAAEVFNIIFNNYSDTKAVKFMKASYEFEQAELNYGTSKQVTKEKREQLLNNLQTARAEMEEFLKKEK